MDRKVKYTFWFVPLMKLWTNFAKPTRTKELRMGFLRLVSPSGHFLSLLAWHRAWMDGSRGALKFPSILSRRCCLVVWKNLGAWTPNPLTGDKQSIQFSEGANTNLPILSFTFHCYSATITHYRLVGLPGLTLAFWSKIDNSTVARWGFTQTLSIRTSITFLIARQKTWLTMTSFIRKGSTSLTTTLDPCLDSKRPLQKVGSISHQQQQLIVIDVFT